MRAEVMRADEMPRETLFDASTPWLGDRIEVRGLRVWCIVGCYPRERRKPQPVILDMALLLPPRDEPDAPFTLQDTFDYARLAGMARFILEHGRFALLESAALALCRTILAPPTPDVPQVRPVSVEVRLAKPRAFESSGVPAVTLFRRAEDMRYQHEHKPFGRAEILYQASDVGVYRLVVAPGRSIVTHVHRQLEESELILGSGLHLQGRAVDAGRGVTWPHDHPHRYDNPSEVEQTILCIDRPAFFQADEIPVAEPASGLQRIPGQSYFMHVEAER